MAQLPEELLSHICSYLRITDASWNAGKKQTNLATLASISLASKAFNRVARPHLWHTLDIGPHVQNGYWRRLVSSVLQRPDTARLVQYLHTHSWEFRWVSAPPGYHGERLRAALEPQLQSTIDGLPCSPEFKQNLQTGMEEGWEDADYALLLWLCTNLKKWELDSPHPVEESLVFAAIREAVADQTLVSSEQTPRPLQHVREIKIEHGDTENSTDLGNISDVLRLPALDTFRGRMLSCDHDTTSFPQSLRSSIKRLFLDFSLIDGNGLRTLLTACSDLETLSIQWGSSIVGPARIEYDRMGQALRQYGRKLKTLRLRPEEAETFEDDEDSYPPLGSLKQLTLLRTLTLPYVALFGGADLSGDRSPIWLRDVLPASLKTLRIADADVEEDEVLDAQLLEVMKDEQFEDLSTIRVSRGEPFSETAQNVGWDDSESNKYWVVLKRSPQPVNDGTQS